MRFKYLSFYIPVLLIMIMLAVNVKSQSTNQNYICTRAFTNDAGSTYLDAIQYFDGFGRPNQQIWRNITPSSKDLVVLKEQDAFGREDRSWLPVAVSGNNGNYVATSFIHSQAIDFYGNDQKPFLKNIYETTPSNRLKTSIGPGQDWDIESILSKTDLGEKTSEELMCKGVKYEYLTNSTSDPALMCKKFYEEGRIITPTGGEFYLWFLGYVPDGKLFVTKKTDEDGNISYEFRDKINQMMLSRKVNDGVFLDTYYVYGEFNDGYQKLSYVLPPEVHERMENGETLTGGSEIKNLIYIYEYDKYGRCIAKKLPNCDWIYYIYDHADRLIFSQNGEQRAKGEWLFSIPDTFGRIALTGICKNTINFIPSKFSPNPLDNIIVKAAWTGGTTVTKGYAITGITLSNPTIYSANFYDEYTFLGNNGIPNNADTQYANEAGYGVCYGDHQGVNKHKSKGLLTGNITAMINPDGTIASTNIYSVMYYDSRQRIIQIKSNNHMTGGTERVYFSYNFIGKPIQRKHIHEASGKTTQTEIHSYTYDHASRLLSVTHKLNGNAQVTLTQYTYDDVGRVKTKKLGVETSAYSYNVRSWVTQITGSKFNQTLTYNTAVNGITPAKALYGGNISAMKWKSGDETTERGYKFTYDGIGRLTAAAYGEGNAITANPGRFNETITYGDKTGNIHTLQRQGKITAGTYGLMDNLTYAYSDNKLIKVTDATTTPVTNPDAFHFVDGANVANEYIYDSNGNIVKDLNKNITFITYNSLNLPSVITFGNGNTATYVYDGAGKKLSVAYKSGTLTTKMDYAGNKVYSNGTLSMILTEEGYVTLSGTTPTYYYYLKDHQGNNRVVINQGGTVQQVNHYYPFGGVFGEGLQTSKQRYKYNGKELDAELGLNMYDYGARHYDAALGRWFTVDPLAEKYYGISSYVYCGNNPVRYIDPTGMSFSEFDEDGKYLRTIKDNWWHNTFVGRNGRIVDSDGNITHKFKFADPKNDVKDLKEGTINKVYFVQESEIINMLSKAGAFTKENKVINADSRYEYISEEGKGGGKFDFSYTGIPNEYPEASYDPLNQRSSMMFLIDGVAHNQMNYGNFLFGAAGRALGLTGFELRMGAHYNSLFNSSSNGYKPQFDARDDQFSIRKGIRHANKQGYRDMYYQVTVGSLQ